MRILVLADIHANLTALEAVIADAQKQGGYDQVWCLGDIVGYGPDPCECIASMQSNRAICVAGNHDLAAIGKVTTNYFNYQAAAAVHWTKSQLMKSDIEFLHNLPLTRVENDFTLVHGSPRDPIWTYIFSVAEAQESLRHFKTIFCLIGHTHVPMYFEFAVNAFINQPESGLKLKLTENRWLINPGGVGQPRDGDPRAAYLILDADEMIVSFFRVEYDIRNVQTRMEQAGLPEGLIYRLSRGR